ncbi:hypothetical protein DNU06_13960 [Putridiphycobacter roseus]|uniref:Ig-like domain-containing protein n=1 Tax=Putridiphycobacter roseus TaxID=2219161 RepID=A0A2W1MVV1_9FLAO|nr:gliding motility-associated C-terminal domain-containing protein [Putridiphycobacter roseus]PZE16229.1 hypothetical protein DNU06_13960 [Putridiphycobacter roseus]
MNLKRILLSLILLFFVSNGHATIWYVDNGNNSGVNTLRDHVEINSSAGDTVIINYSGGILLTSAITIANDDLTIIGPYPTHNSFVGEYGGNIFEINNKTGIVIKGLGFKHMVSGNDLNLRAIKLTGASELWVEDCLFENNKPVSGNGGAIAVEGTAELTVWNSSFFGNVATNNGGAVAFDNADNKGNFFNCTFHKNNAAGVGGAVYIEYVPAINSIRFINNTFYQNQASDIENAGHAIWLNVTIQANIFFPHTRYAFFENNIIAENYGATGIGQYQVYVPTTLTLLSLLWYDINFSIYAENNYYLFQSVAEKVVYAFEGSLINDYTAVDNFSGAVNSNLRSTHVTDGYGLKYFPIIASGSPLINTGDNNISAASQNSHTYETSDHDARRAPRVLDFVVDIGAVEYTSLRVTNDSSGNSPGSFRRAINNLSAAEPINYIAFDLTPGSTSIEKNNSGSVDFDQTVYIDGFSQDGSKIPGPRTGIGASDGLVPASDLVIIKAASSNPSNSGVYIEKPNSVIAGLEIINFDGNGIGTDVGASNAIIFGNYIHGNTEAGVLLNSSSSQLGGLFHYQRNVISDNGFDHPNVIVPYIGTNVHLSNTVSGAKIYGNIIGLAGNGIDSLNLQRVSNKQAHGIYTDAISACEMGSEKIFGQNTIAGNDGSGILTKTAGSDNRIDNNHIGVDYMGETIFPNYNGISLETASNGYGIGSRKGNIISGNEAVGVHIKNGNAVKMHNNIIGGNKSLDSDFGNDIGILIDGTSGNTNINRIGDVDYSIDSMRNIIVGNELGIHLSGSNVQNTRIIGNLIGLPFYDQNSVIANTVGVKIDNGAHDNVIGFTPGSSDLNSINFISGNTTGVWLEGSTTNNNAIYSNVIGSALIAGNYVGVGVKANNTGVKITDLLLSNTIGSNTDLVQQLQIHHQNIGIQIDSSYNQNISNSYIGIDVNDQMIGNNIGIYVDEKSDLISIGNSGINNVISGNDSVGIYLNGTTNAKIGGNLIGTNISGNSPKGNLIGIVLEGTDYTSMGDLTNTISGNKTAVSIINNAAHTTVKNNYIGLNSSGLALISGSKYGIAINNTDQVNTIGDNMSNANYITVDSVGIGLKDSKNQIVKGNVFGYDKNNIIKLGSSVGTGIIIKDSKFNKIGGDNAAERNVIVNRNIGIVLNGADTNQIQYTFMGVDYDGLNGGGQNLRGGIVARTNASVNNAIGPFNVFGGSKVAVYLGANSSENKLFKNYFGTDTTFTNSFQNDTALILLGASNNQIGGIGDSANYILNNTNPIILAANSNSNVLKQNYIGVKPDGTFAITGGSNGIVINNSFNNLIGGTDLTSRNYIARNNQNGIVVINNASGNSFLRNEIYNNSGLGINIGAGGNSATGVTGLQDELHTPIINTSFPCTPGADIQLAVQLNNLNIGDTYYLDVYANQGHVDGTGFGEGKNSILLQSFVATASTEMLNIPLTAAAVAPYILTANDTSFTAILTLGSTGSSSEFGKNSIVLDAPIDPIIVNENEVCKDAAAGGRILVDNSANSVYTFDVLIGGVNGDFTSPNYLRDTLAPGSYAVQINYSNGCVFNAAANSILTQGPTFESLVLDFADDTCGLSTGMVTIDTTNSTAPVFNAPFTYSIDGSNFVAGANFSNLTASSLLDVKVKAIVSGQTCISENTVTHTVNAAVVPKANLDFVYSTFCEDTTGYVVSLPAFAHPTLTQYYLINALSGTFNPATGQLVNAAAGETYEMYYAYGSCSSDTFTVYTNDVPSPNFTFNDFCQNESSISPLSIVSAGGTFSLYNSPSGTNAVLNNATGELVPSPITADLTVGTYELIYLTSDAICPRRDTNAIEIFTKAVKPILSATNINTGLDTAYFCPSTPDEIWSTNTSASTTFFKDPTTVNDSVYVPTLTPNTNYNVSYFNTVNYTVPSTKTCQSDTGTVNINVFDLPVTPVIAYGDTSYCFGEAIATLADTSQAVNTNWFLNSGSNLVSSNNSTYVVDTVGHNNNIITIYAQDSTGTGCASAQVSVEIVLNPEVAEPDVNLTSDGTLNPSNVTICLTSADTLISSLAAANTFWYTVLGTETNSKNYPLEFPQNTDTTLYYFADKEFTAVETKTCYSDTNHVDIHTNFTPVTPVIAYGDTAYCFGEAIVALTDTAQSHHTNWFLNTTTDLVSINNPSYVVDTIGHNNNIITIYAQDSTATGCLSERDTAEIIIYPKVIAPTVNAVIAGVTDPVSLDICPTIDDTLIASTAALKTSWYTANASPVTMKSYVPDYADNSDSVLSYYAFETYLDFDGVTCHSDTNTINIHTYFTPVMPNITNGDTAYCAQSEIVDLGNDALGTHAINWFEINTSNQVGPTGPTHAILNYAANTTLAVYARDSTGQSCYSDTVTTQIVFHDAVVKPNLSLNTGAGTLMISSWDEVTICPQDNLLDTIYADTDSTDTFWYYEYAASNADTTNKFISQLGGNSIIDTTLIYYRQVVYPTRICRSEIDSIQLQVLPTPVKPNLIDVAYCEWETVDLLSVMNGTNIKWYEGTDSVYSFTYQPKIQLLPYTNNTIQIYALDSTGITTSDLGCVSTLDTVNIRYHADPNAPILTYSGDGSIANPDTLINICPTVPESLMANTHPDSTYWATPVTIGTPVNGTSYGLNSFAEESDNVILYFVSIKYDVYGEKICYSDTNKINIHTFKTPEQPMVLQDTAYCFGENIADLSVDLVAPAVNKVVYYNSQTSVNDTITVSPFTYVLPVPTNYNNYTIAVNAFDFTGDGCYSDTSEIDISFHGTPIMPIVETGLEGLIPANDSIAVCPNSNEFVVSINTHKDSTAWYTDPNIKTIDVDYDLNFGDLTDNTLYYYSFVSHNTSSVLPLVCQSAIDSVIVHTFETWQTPVIMANGSNVGGQIEYCQYESIDLFESAGSNTLNWYQVGNTPTGDSTLAISYDILQGAYSNGTQIIELVSYDSTGYNCKSAEDTTFIKLHPRPDEPILTSSVYEYCEGENIQDINSNATANNWFVNDSTILATDLLTADFTPPAYSYVDDSTITYYAQAESIYGCQSYFSEVGVTYHPTPELPSMNIPLTSLTNEDTIIYCPGENLDTLVSALDLSWYQQASTILSVNDSFAITFSNFPVATVNNLFYFYTQSYGATFTCKSELGKVNVQIYDEPVKPKIDKDNIDTTYCEGETLFDQLTVVGATGTGHWYDANNDTLIHDFEYDMSGPLLADSIYYYSYTDVHGCNSIQVPITIYMIENPENPVISSSDSVYCNYEIIDSLTVGTGVMTNWYFGDTTAANLLIADTAYYIPLEGAGDYYAYTIENGCISEVDTFNIFIEDIVNAPEISSMETTFCLNVSADTIFLANGVNGYWFANSNFLDTLSADTNHYMPMETFDEEITYYVNYIDESIGCYSLYDSITLYHYAFGEVSAGENQELCAGYYADLEATGGIQYLWSTMDTTAAISVNPLYDTYYTVSITDVNNCVNSDSLLVRIKLQAECENTIYTAFSPNGDGVNETWEITGIEGYTSPTVYIFNRWGDQIAKFENYDNVYQVWDGINQKTQKAVVFGTYYYIIESEGKKVTDGWVEVLK